MPETFDIWKLLTGVAIFLLGMKFMEESLRQLAGRRFKLFLKKQTASKPKAIIGGAAVTAILQSSSVVNLMVLAFAGSNVIQMQNALAVIFGANIGTTFSSWIIATAGFKLNIESIAFPLAGVSGIILSLSNRESQWFKWSKFLFGFSFLFIGLNYIKDGMLGLVQQLDLSEFRNYPLVFFLLLGFIITSLIQSSSTTMAIVLSALHADAIGLTAGTAIVLGSEAGTAVKLVVAAVNGNATKKRVAWGNFLYNILTSLLVFIFLNQVNRLITTIISIKDPLIGLVAFQSLINIFGIILFYPFLDVFGKFLLKRFTNETDAVYISKIKPADTELATAALENEIKCLLLYTLDFIRQAFEIPRHNLAINEIPNNHRVKNPLEAYDNIKQLHGQIHGYGIKIQNNITGDKENQLLTQKLLSVNRNTMYAAKSFKDALQDINQLHNSSNDIKYNIYMEASANIEKFCDQINGLLAQPSPPNNFATIKSMYDFTTTGYTDALKLLYNNTMRQNLSELEISTLINFNREMYTGCKSLVFAAKDYLLNDDEAQLFDDLPGFIR